MPTFKAVGLGQDDGKALTDAYARQQAVDAPGGIGSRATLVVDHSTFEVKITAEQVGWSTPGAQYTPGSRLIHTWSRPGWVSCRHNLLESTHIDEVFFVFKSG